MGNGLLMPVIRVSQQTGERLQRHARPLEHTANDVVQTALNALEAQVKRGGSLREEYRYTDEETDQPI
jgi:hypothetical protein